MKKCLRIHWVLLWALSGMAYLGQAQIICPDDNLEAKQKRLSAVELTVGPKPWKGIVGSLGFIYYLHRMKKAEYTTNANNKTFPRFYAKANVNYAADRHYGINHRAYAGEITVGAIPFRLSKSIFPAFIVGGFTSYDRPAKENNLPNDIVAELTGFKSGFFGGAEVLFFFGNSRVALVGNYSQRFLTGKNWGDRRVYAGLGIRCHFSSALPEKKKIRSREPSKPRPKTNP